MREEVCSEAIRLTSLLAQHTVGNQPRTHALLALMLLNGARLPARVDVDGNLVRLQEQDRTLWDRGMLARGHYHLAQSAGGSEITDYHLQAAIAACHCSAPDYKSTDWSRILSLYDRLVQFDQSPVAALNRAVAVAEVRGPRAGLDAVAAIPNLPSLDSYYLLHSVLGEFESRLKQPQKAAAHFQRSFDLAELKSERDFIAGRLRDCELEARQKKL